MAKPPLKLNRTKYSLSKKGILSFVFSKFAFLVFGIIITASFFYLISIQKEMQQFDELARTSEALSNVMGMIEASPFNISISFKPDINATLNFTNTSFEIMSNERSLKHTIPFPINTTSIVIMDNCINITKTNVTEVSECQ